MLKSSPFSTSAEEKKRRNTKAELYHASEDATHSWTCCQECLERKQLKSKPEKLSQVEMTKNKTKRELERK
jgi:hypothetical protein